MTLQAAVEKPWILAVLATPSRAGLLDQPAASCSAAGALPEDLPLPAAHPPTSSLLAAHLSTLHPHASIPLVGTHLPRAEIPPDPPLWAGKAVGAAPLQALQRASLQQAAAAVAAAAEGAAVDSAPHLQLPLFQAQYSPSLHCQHRAQQQPWQAAIRRRRGACHSSRFPGPIPECYWLLPAFPNKTHLVNV